MVDPTLRAGALADGSGPAVAIALVAAITAAGDIDVHRRVLSPQARSRTMALTDNARHRLCTQLDAAVTAARLTAGDP